MNIKPLDDRVIVEPNEAEEVSPGGILLPEIAQEKPQRGLVAAVGPGKMLADGSRAAMSVSSGNTVIFTKYGGTEIEIHGIKLVILRESDILGVVEG